MQLCLYNIYSLSLAATGSTDGNISIWDVQTQRLRSTLSHEVIYLCIYIQLIFFFPLFFFFE